MAAQAAWPLICAASEKQKSNPTAKHLPTIEFHVGLKHSGESLLALFISGETR